MKKILGVLIFSLLFVTNINSGERESQLNELFNQLKNNDNSITFKIEMKIWEIWSTHPSKENLTQLLAEGSALMSEKRNNKAYTIFFQESFF